MRQIGLAILVSFGLLAIGGQPSAAESVVPEPFQRFDANSDYTISYDDFTALLNILVVNTGRSTREVVAPTRAKTGTRMKAKVKRQTANEGNRFYYEEVAKNEGSKQLLLNIQTSLEQIPDEAPLEYFSRDEQLAYWLNLYNVTLLNQIIAEYPIRDLKKLFKGKKSILNKKLLTVAGIPLSLNDIQFNILKNNYDNNPLIIYGLYQGYVGGPNIRKSAYTGADVHRALANNAMEFVNSNRGTYARDERVFRVSSWYGHSKAFFPNFKSDLSTHLLKYLEGPERTRLASATSIKPDISDWTVTDLGGTRHEVGGSLADSRAALLDSVKGTTPMDGGGVMGAAVGAGSSSTVAKAQRLSRIEPELLEYLQDLNTKRKAENERNANVLIEDFAESPADSNPESDPDESEER